RRQFRDADNSSRVLFGMHECGRWISGAVTSDSPDTTCHRGLTRVGRGSGPEQFCRLGGGRVGRVFTRPTEVAVAAQVPDNFAGTEEVGWVESLRGPPRWQL